MLHRLFGGIYDSVQSSESDSRYPASQQADEAGNTAGLCPGNHQRLSRLPRSMAFWGYVLLPFGGLSCIAQTYSMIRETDLSLGNYVAHKVVQTVAAFGFYLWVFAG